MTTTNSIATALLLAAALAVAGGAAQAQCRTPVSCGPDGKLPMVTDGSCDLIIKDSPHHDICEVDAGTYKFRNVNILAGGTLKFNDAVIDFWAANVLVEAEGSLIAGVPDPIGTNGGQLTIHLYGKDQGPGTGNGDGGIGIACLSGNHDGSCGVPPDIWNSNIDPVTMKPVLPAQARKIKDLPSGPSYLGFRDDYFYPYHPLMFDDGKAGDFPVGYFGYKVIGVSYGGTLQLFGKRGATYASGECGTAPSSSGTSWARLAMTVTPTDPAPQTVKVDRKLTLEKGDKIVVTTTDYLPGHSEELTVSDKVTCSETFNVDEKFKYIHNGERYPLTSVPTEVGLDPQLVAAGAETRAAVALLTRSIRIVSAGDDLALHPDFPDEPPPGSTTPGYYFGGHLVARQGFKTFQVQGVEFKQMGQGGRIGHYPVHFHHARRTPNVAPNDTFVRDSSIHDSMTRWIVLHGTQDVKLERNVGYKSIGHGFYLEDGTEINNTLTANLGIFARAAIDNVQNPRKVPGILAAPDLHDQRAPDGTPIQISEAVPYRSDYDHPTVFWFLNGWNDFRDNMAAGAGTCGVCYWFVPAYNSGMSADKKWESYASMQSAPTRAASSPLKSFVGNSCTTAMTAFQTVLQTTACAGVGFAPSLFPTVSDIENKLAAPSPATDPVKAAGYYPNVRDQGHQPTRCLGADCSSQPRICAAGSLDDCMVTVLDHFTTSFNWASFNFAAIWLRPQWYLVTDSVITDVQQAGLSMVTGGGYTDSDITPGHWGLVRKSVFIGNTQDCPNCKITSNPLASNGGPFNPQPSARYPNGLSCELLSNGSRPDNYCLSKAEGVSHKMDNFGMYQRLFSLYDGPALQESNAYLNVTGRPIDDCVPIVDGPNKVGTCKHREANGSLRDSAWLAGAVHGLRKARPTPGDPSKDFCYMPNAAIGWKQPNGFYYPPANHSANLYFAPDVEVRHFVVSPLLVEGTLDTDIARVTNDYCVWDRAIFEGFAGNDRQTVLNDDDGTLSGYEKTTIINLDDFFTAPVEAKECRSDESSRTSPYDYVTTVLYPKCVTETGDRICARPASAAQPEFWNDGDWNRACTSQKCYGVPLWRQDEMPNADKNIPRSIRMMGQDTAQRSSLTVNHGTYYLDTTVPKDKQLAQCDNNDPVGNPCVVNVFKPGGTYYVFLLFAKAVDDPSSAQNTEQTYRFYVGENTDFDPASIRMVQAEIGKNPVAFTDRWPPPPAPDGVEKKPRVARWLNGDKLTAKGVVEVVINARDIPGITGTDGLIAKKRKASCQPASFCTYNDTTRRCEDVDSTTAPKSDAVCRWAIADQDCPDGGCVGFRFTLPAGFATGPAIDPRPPAACLNDAPPWKVTLDDRKVPDSHGVCPQEADKLPADFCSQ